MTQTKYALFKVKERGEGDYKAWEDTLELNLMTIKDPEKACKDMIEYFNSTLIPGDIPREFVELLKVDEMYEDDPTVFRVNDEDPFYEEDEQDYI